MFRNIQHFKYILFQGATNNDMLGLIMTTLSQPIPKQMLVSGEFVSKHFTEKFEFMWIKKDPFTKKVVTCYC